VKSTMAIEEDFSDARSSPEPEEEETMSHTQDDDARSEMSEEEEEDECRICRGPAEEGDTLFSPCKCAGSIRLVHQDCLENWLQVTGGNKCELCKTKFIFAPRYADGTPTHLPPLEIFLGLSRRAIARWLPFGIRCVVVASLWLFVVPLVTTYLYHGWIHRPSSILTRWRWHLVVGDTVSGAVIAAVIVVSFLSMMSFADFLRFHGQDDEGRAGERGRGRAGGRAQRDREENVEDGHVEQEEDVDDVVLDHQNFIPRHQNFMQPVGVMDQRQPLFAQHHEERGQAHRHVHWVDLPPEELARDIDEMPDDLGEQRRELRRRLRAVEAMRREIDAAAGNDAQGAVRADTENEIRADDDENDQVTALLNEQEYDDQAGPQEDLDRLAEIMQAQEEEEPNEEEGNLGEMNPDEPLFPDRNENRFEPEFEPLDPVPNQDEEPPIHVALDELLGLRGPFGAVIRNILWLLAFNTTYLGIFAFIPKAVGNIVYSRIVNTTTVTRIANNIPYLSASNSTDFSVSNAISALNAESLRLENTFQLPDLITLGLGYFGMAGFVLLWQWGILINRHMQQHEEGDQEANSNHEGNEDRARDADEVRREQLQNLLERAVENINEERDENDAILEQELLDQEEEGDVISIGQALARGVDYLAAIVKVSILLFLKMFFLPLLLGIWLDAATLSLFGDTISNRILYAGGDLFGAIMLHWVIGITFMLLVTVSVLQLREVAHPNVLAGLIRPQEPQPDLLGNLMQDSGITHARRMLLSLAIYALLLTIHVWLPSHLLLLSGLGKHLPFVRPKFCRIVLPQLQVPIEVLLFHLSMLGFLEKYKNRIGEMQHEWLVFMCDNLGLTQHLLPRSVEKFELVGSREVFCRAEAIGGDHYYVLPDETVAEATSNSSSEEEASTGNGQTTKPTHPSTHRFREVSQVDPFWYELVSKSKSDDVDAMILANIQRVDSTKPPVYHKGQKKRNGQRVLSSQSYIGLPEPPITRGDRKRNRRPEDTDAAGKKSLLCTTMDAYRLKKNVRDDGKMVIEFWKEIPGDPIPRPPEGWDDLGEGGAEVQGRWAWGKERKSEIEEGVAKRTPFYASGNSWLSALPLVLKCILLILLSWAAVTMTVCGTLSVPLSVGRFIFFLLRVPDRYVHDPLGFAIGGVALFPIVKVVSSSILDRSSTRPLYQRTVDWARAFRLPPKQKILVFGGSALLWLGISPLLFGAVYELLIIKSREWFLHEEPLITPAALAFSWAVGTLLLNAWAGLCYVGAFTWTFWKEVGNGVLEGPGQGEQANNGPQANRNREAPPQAPANTAHASDYWQGEQGRIARFFSIWKSVLLNWEWDQVDSAVLMKECSVLIVKQAATSCIIPLAFYSLWLIMMGCMGKNSAGISLPVIGFVSTGMYRMVIFRAFAVLTMMVQLGRAYRTPLKSWFHAAHQAARDDRYLIGQILLNYSPE